MVSHSGTRVKYKYITIQNKCGNLIKKLHEKHVIEDHLSRHLKNDNGVAYKLYFLLKFEVNFPH